MQRNRKIKMAITAAVATAIAFAAAAHAADGVLEINQACVATGCFPGDTPGFPVTARASQSYVLTSNLTVPDGETTAVELFDYATLDLGGFAIAGTTVCTGVQFVTCTGGSGNGYGVEGRTGVTIRNGTIRNMGTYGIIAGSYSLVEDVLLLENANRGIGGSNGRGWIVRNVRVVRNGSYGIDLAIQSAYGLVTGNVVEGNARSGISGLGLLLLDNTIANSEHQGILANFAGEKTGFARNVLHYNNGGDAEDQTTGGVQIGTNVCGTDLTCP